ncbi:paraneoplastic antigen-like protein 8A [Trichechus manatus latirostris]|uniref:Paraneoplastic antigen-like protein 8A n=1 Tax=Trichechus manatus latirostris TaxID=127582 RepID=A0A2Y9G251_TRIMA|nr:paraneoplastic antigen-like protein 8A [Trichechus manatus latirostris]
MAAMHLLEDWCRGMDVDIHRALLVTGIPEDCGQAEIEETLSGVFTLLGPYHVLNKMFFREENAKAVLIEVGEGMNLSTIPREFPGRGGVWRVVCRDATQDAEFLKNLHEFLESEGRTVEDVIRLLQLDRPPQRQSRNLTPQNWAEAFGVLLASVMQIVFYMDAEMRYREEARAQELAEAKMIAAWSSEAEGRVKKEPGPARGVGRALKMENPNSWCDMEDEAPKPLFRKARAKNPSRRKKQNRAPKQEPMFRKKTRSDLSNSSADLEDSQADDTERMETSECVCSSRKPPVKQEESSLKKLGAKCARKVHRDPPQDGPSEAESPGGASESDQDGGQEVPPKKKAMGWVSTKRLAPIRKKKKVSLGPVSYVLVDSEEARKKSVIPKKGPGWRKDASVLKAPRGPKSVETPASASQHPKAKPEGSPYTSKGKSDCRSHSECVKKWMMWEEQEWEVEEEVPSGAVGQLGIEDGPSASEEEADTAVKVLEGENSDSEFPRSL